MYKLIVTDMDGTFLNGLGEITRKNIKAVKKAMKRGVQFAIVTGRPYVSVKDILNDVKITCSCIGCNGAQVTGSDGKLITSHYLDTDNLIKIIRIAKEAGLYYQLYDDHYIYTSSRLNLLKLLKSYSKKSIKRHITLRRLYRGIKRLFFTEVSLKHDLLGFVSERRNKFYKIQIASVSAEDLDVVCKKIRDVPDIDITSSNYFNIEVGPKGVTKGTALEELAKSMNIKREEIIAFGDNFNDIPMLQYAGCGVAVKNAEPPVKKEADYITKSNEDNGVAYAIEKFIFNDEG
ncbi:MAG TPA: hypothetical protein DD426_03845 [Clostridiaceae bacterium]|nr:hypothetical protein [Clostridiaceae bacterium]